MPLLGFSFDSICQEANVSREKLDDIFRRRNQIAHQSDRHHADANMDTITDTYVDDSITAIKSFVEKNA